MNFIYQWRFIYVKRNRKRKWYSDASDLLLWRTRNWRSIHSNTGQPRLVNDRACKYILVGHIAPQTKVVMYSGANYTGKTLAVGNGSLEIITVDFSEDIGWIPDDPQLNFSWSGINMNDQCRSFKLYGEIQKRV